MIAVYDTLTGEVVKTLSNKKYENCVRDVHWNPTQPAELVTSSVSVCVCTVWCGWSISLSLSLSLSLTHTHTHTHTHSGMEFFSCGLTERDQTWSRTLVDATYSVNLININSTTTPVLALSYSSVIIVHLP